MIRNPGVTAGGEGDFHAGQGEHTDETEVSSPAVNRPLLLLEGGAQTESESELVQTAEVGEPDAWMPLPGIPMSVADPPDALRIVTPRMCLGPPETVSPTG